MTEWSSLGLAGGRMLRGYLCSREVAVRAHQSGSWRSGRPRASSWSAAEPGPGAEAADGVGAGDAGDGVVVDLVQVILLAQAGVALRARSHASLHLLVSSFSPDRVLG